MRVFEKAVLILGLMFSVAGSAQAPQAANDALEMLSNIEPMALSESDVTRFISTAQEFHERDVDIMEDEDVPTQAEMLARVRENGEAMSILKANGFTPEGFSDVAMNIVLAMGALEMRANQAEIDQAMAQLEAMKGQLPQAQYDKIADQVLGVQRAFAKAPPANVDLVAKHRDELDAIGEE